MNQEQLLFMRLPSVVFRTKHPFNDKNTDDMHYGDMDKQALISLGVIDISSKVEPYNLIKFNNNYSSFHPSFSPLNYSDASGERISKQECVDILFEEMKELAKLFYNYKYTELVMELIDHFRYGDGRDFTSSTLDKAYSERIYADRYQNPLEGIKIALNRMFGKTSSFSTYDTLFSNIEIEINRRKLTIFDKGEDRTNGLGISVHDIYAQEIKIISFRKNRTGWDASIYFKAQDHFGLDKTDVSNSFYRAFRFFRIWFFLQRHKDYGFKPFFTNFSSTQELKER